MRRFSTSQLCYLGALRRWRGSSEETGSLMSTISMWRGQHINRSKMMARFIFAVSLLYHKVVDLIKSGGDSLTLTVISLPAAEVDRLEPPESGPVQ